MSYFPTPKGCSIIGAAELNGRVRNGNGWILCAMVARNLGQNLDDSDRSVHGFFACVRFFVSGDEVVESVVGLKNHPSSLTSD